MAYVAVVWQQFYTKKSEMNYFFLLEMCFLQNVFYITRSDFGLQCCKLPSYDEMLVHEGFLL